MKLQGGNHATINGRLLKNTNKMRNVFWIYKHATNTSFIQSECRTMFLSSVMIQNVGYFFDQC